MDTVLIALIAFIPAILLLVMVHEFGHFATARALGVKVLEFGVGFPPRAFGVYTGKSRVMIDGDTRFVNVDGMAGLRSGQLVKVSSAEDQEGNLVARVVEVPERHRGLASRLPGRGGAPAGSRAVAKEQWVPDEYLRHEGKIRTVESDHFLLADMLYSVNWAPLGGFVRLAGESNPQVPRSLASKGVGTRVLVLVAGPLMNLIFPIVIFAVLVIVPQVVVGQVNAGSAAEMAGMLPGDIVLKADGNGIENAGDLRRATALSAGAEMEWLVLREGKEEVLRVAPRFSESDDRWLVGINLSLENPRVKVRSDPPWTAISGGITSTWDVMVQDQRQAFSGSFAAGEAPELSGPIGIAQLTGEITREIGPAGWLFLLILLSLNLAIFNILPIPMLDGGRLVFVVLEWVRRGKRVPPEKEGMVHLIGFVVLLGFILAISVKDINRIIQGNSFLGG